MSRVQAYLDRATHDLLKDYAEKSECSLSHAARKIIASYLMGEEQEFINRTENRQQFLLLMNTLKQVLACVYDSQKITVSASSVNECLEIIKNEVLNAQKN